MRPPRGAGRAQRSGKPERRSGHFRPPPTKGSIQMPKTFREALMSHLEKTPYTVAELSRASGVTQDVIKKLKSRENASTTVENGISIANYFGKSLNAFMATTEPDEASELSDLFAQLTEEESKMVKAQLRGLITARQTTKH